jgi:hypothetical protein
VLPEALPLDLGSMLNSETFSSGVSGNGDVSSFREKNGPSHGKLVVFRSNGSFTYDPDDDFVGIDTFSFVAVNEFGDSEPAEVSVRVMPKERIERIKISGVPDRLAIGSSINVFVEATDQYGAPIAIPPDLVFEWRTDNPAVLSVIPSRSTVGASVAGVGFGYTSIYVSSPLLRVLAGNGICVPDASPTGGC